MAIKISLQRGENVTIHAVFPPTVPGRLCDWTVTSIVGGLPDVDPLEYAQWFEKLPERIETVSILNTALFPHVLSVLVMLWMLSQWRCLHFSSSRRLRKEPYHPCA